MSRAVRLLRLTLVWLLLFALTDAAPQPSFAPRREPALATIGGSIVVSGGGTLSAEVLSKSASFTHDFGIDQPVRETFFTSAAPGMSIIDGSFADGTTLVFFLYVQNTGATYFSNTDRADVIQEAPNSWAIKWEDATDFDYNDLVVRVTVGDTGACCPWAYGAHPDGASSPDPVNLATGSFITSAGDLALPGRVLGLSFSRWYNSPDSRTGPLGPAWTHSYNWTLLDLDRTVEVRRGDGRVDTFTRLSDGTYAQPPDVFDTLLKNGDGSFTLVLTNQVRYEFSTAGRLTRIHEPAGNQITLAYSGGNLTAITDTVGRQLSLGYDGSSRLIQLQDPLGRKVSYVYDGEGRLSTVTDMIGNATGQDPSLHQWRYAYEGTTRHITTITDPDGRVRVTNAYDSQGRVVVEQRDALGALTTMSYGAGETVLTDPRGHQTTYSFDSRMRVLSQSDTVGGVTYTISYSYDAVGNRTSVTDRNGKRTDFSYDSRGNVLAKTDPSPDGVASRPVTSFSYDAKNNLTAVTDALGFSTTLSYEATSNLLLSVSRQIDGSSSALTKYEYADTSNPGLPTRIISPRGSAGPSPDYTFATTLRYDSQGNLIERIDPDGAKTTFAYDGAGRLTSFVDPDGYAQGASPAEHTWSIGYDETDRETRRSDPLGNALAFGYDRAGNRTTLSDRRGNLTNYAYDANTRLASVQQKPDPAGSTVYSTQVSRDANGNATRISQANGVVTDYAFDALNRLTSVTSHPDAQTSLTTSYALDGHGQPITRTTADGVTVSYAYDALWRLTNVSAAGLTTISYAYDALGRRTQMSDGTGITAYSYDGLGRLTQVAAPEGTLSYAYDLDGNRTTLGYPGGQNVTYAYSPGGRVASVTDWAARVSSYTYTPSGLVSALDYPNGMRATYSYDRAQRLTSLVNAVGTTTIASHAYLFDPEGNRTQLDEFVSGITAPAATTWSASVRVNSDSSFPSQESPALAVDADGAGFLVWEDERDFFKGRDVYFSRRDPGTGAWSSNTKVSDDTGSSHQQRPAIALDGSGNAYAIWQDERNGSSPDVFFSKRPAASGLWSANVRVNDDAAGSAIHAKPRLAVAGDGSAVAVWLDERSAQKNIYSARLAAGASSWSANLRVTDNTTSAKDFPDVAIGPDGTAHAVWTDDRGGTKDVYYASLAPGASSWSTNTRLSDGATHDETHPRVGADASGNLHAAWLENTPFDGEIRVSRRLAGGQSWEASRRVSPTGAEPLWALYQGVALAVAPDGAATVAWVDGRATYDRIWGADYDPATGSWAAAEQMSDAPSGADVRHPTLALREGQLLLGWSDDRRDFGDVFARRRVSSSGVDRFTYAYDGLNRLLSVGTTNPENFSYDAATNIASRTGPSATYSHDTSNRVTSDGTRSFTWSGADRLTERGSDTFAYDALGRLTSATVAGVTRTYIYNGDGLLASRTDGAGTVSYLWDVSIAPGLLLQAGSDLIVHGLGPLYLVRADASTVSYARDGLNSVRAEVSASGTVSKSFRYAAYGALAQSSGGDPALLAYTGELVDPSGLTYLRARWYDPGTGRLLTRDPLGGSPTSPVSLNRYGYAAGNPILNSDPTGLCTDRAPDGGRVLYCIERWIPTEVSCRGTDLICGMGDGRWWPLPHAGTFKMRALVKSDGTVDFDVGESQLTNRHGVLIGPRLRGSLSDCGGGVTHAGIVVSCVAWSAFSGAPGAPGPIRTRVDIAIVEGRPIVRAAGTLYPSLAVYRYGGDGPHLLYFYDGKPAGVEGLDQGGTLPNLLAGK